MILIDYSVDYLDNQCLMINFFMFDVPQDRTLIIVEMIVRTITVIKLQDIIMIVKIIILTNFFFQPELLGKSCFEFIHTEDQVEIVQS